MGQAERPAARPCSAGPERQQAQQRGPPTRKPWGSTLPNWADSVSNYDRRQQNSSASGSISVRVSDSHASPETGVASESRPLGIGEQDFTFTLAGSQLQVPRHRHRHQAQAHEQAQTVDFVCPRSANRSRSAVMRSVCKARVAVEELRWRRWKRREMPQQVCWVCQYSSAACSRNIQ